jgi:hypothetical protein
MVSDVLAEHVLEMTPRSGRAVYEVPELDCPPRHATRPRLRVPLVDPDRRVSVAERSRRGLPHQALGMLRVTAGLEV